MERIDEDRLQPEPRKVTLLREAIAVVERAPEDRVNLIAYQYEDPECGTFYCAAGLLATSKEFNAKGLTLRSNHVCDGLLPCYKGLFGLVGMNALFQDNHAFQRYFASRGAGEFDYALLGGSNIVARISDKELALARLRKGLELELGRGFQWNKTMAEAEHGKD